MLADEDVGHQRAHVTGHDDVCPAVDGGKWRQVTGGGGRSWEILGDLGRSWELCLGSSWETLGEVSEASFIEDR